MTDKKTKLFWGAGRNGWKIYGVWWRQRVLIGVSVVLSPEKWDDTATCRKCKERFQYD